MTNCLRAVQRLGLKLLILSLFIHPFNLSSQDKGKELELPKVVIYGKYLGKMQFGPKKDFYAYIIKDNLFPLSRAFSPEIHFPPQRKLPGRIKMLTNYWMLLDAGGGNWWADKVLLNTGLRNASGFLSFLFKDFRRKGWAEDHAVNNYLGSIQGTLNKGNYYTSVNLFYNYYKIIKGPDSVGNTFETHIGGAGLLSRFDFGKVALSFSGDFSVNRYLDRWLGGIYSGTCETVQENISKYSVRYFNPLEYFDVYGNADVEITTKRGVTSGLESSQSITSFDLLLKKTFNGMYTIKPGLRMFIEKGKFETAPLISLKTMIPNLELYPFITYFRRDRINTVEVIYNKCPFETDMDDYTVLDEKNITAGLEGKGQKLTYRVSYSHIEYGNYPAVYVGKIRTRKDVLKTNISFDLTYLSADFEGSYTLRERILFEPVSKVKAKIGYKVFFPIVLFAGLNSSFGIKKSGSEEIDIFLLNAGIEREIFKNFALKFEVENIFDQRYEIWDGYTEGGIQFFVSLKAIVK